MKPRPVLEPDEWDAPRAIPSAAAWMTRPRVVEKDRRWRVWLWEWVGDEERSERE